MNCRPARPGVTSSSTPGGTSARISSSSSGASSPVTTVMSSAPSATAATAGASSPPAGTDAVRTRAIASSSAAEFSSGGRAASNASDATSAACGAAMTVTEPPSNGAISETASTPSEANSDSKPGASAKAVVGGRMSLRSTCRTSAKSAITASGSSVCTWTRVASPSPAIITESPSSDRRSAPPRSPTSRFVHQR